MFKTTIETFNDNQTDIEFHPPEEVTAKGGWYLKAVTVVSQYKIPGEHHSSETTFRLFWEWLWN